MDDDVADRVEDRPDHRAEELHDLCNEAALSSAVFVPAVTFTSKCATARTGAAPTVHLDASTCSTTTAVSSCFLCITSAIRRVASRCSRWICSRASIGPANLMLTNGMGLLQCSVTLT